MDQFQAYSLDEYCGQKELKRTLGVHVNATLATGRRFPHTLLAAWPGYGKSTLAVIVSDLLDVELAQMDMPIRPKDFIEELRYLDDHILFLDEIHRVPKAQQEDLLSVLQNGYYQTSTGERIFIPNVCVIAATTERDKVIRPLYDRFELKPIFETYSDTDMQGIVQVMGRKVSIEFTDTTAMTLGRAAGGTPRVARSLVMSARSLVDAGMGASVEEILRLSGVDEDGLDRNHYDYLRAVKAMGGIAGLDRLNNLLHLPKPVLLDVERLLFDRELITYGQTGRTITPRGHQKIKSPKKIETPVKAKDPRAVVL